MTETVSVVRIVIVAVVVTILLSLAWRWACRKWTLPCPSLLAGLLENRLFQRIAGTSVILDRLNLQPGQRILEIGPGPGRLLIPAAKRILPNGDAVGIDIQSGMIEHLKARAKQDADGNLTAILGDGTQPHVPEVSFDVAILCTVLGEIPDRAAVLSQCYRALKSGGTLSITEMFGDPHYQSRSTVLRLAENAGFHLQAVLGHWWLFTATFIKP